MGSERMPSASPRYCCGPSEMGSGVTLRKRQPRTRQISSAMTSESTNAAQIQVRARAGARPGAAAIAAALIAVRAALVRRGGGELSGARGFHLFGDPGVGRAQAVAKPNGRLPAERGPQVAVVAVAAAHALRRRQIVPQMNLLSGDAGHNAEQLVDGHQLVAAEVERVSVIGLHQAEQSLEAIVDVHERARLQAVAPDLDLIAGLRAGQLAAYRGRRLFASAAPRPERTVDVMKAHHARFDAEILAKVLAHLL